MTETVLYNVIGYFIQAITNKKDKNVWPKKYTVANRLISVNNWFDLH